MNYEELEEIIWGKFDSDILYLITFILFMTSGCFITPFFKIIFDSTYSFLGSFFVVLFIFILSNFLSRYIVSLLYRLRIKKDIVLPKNIKERTREQAFIDQEYRTIFFDLSDIEVDNYNCNELIRRVLIKNPSVNYINIKRKGKSNYTYKSPLFRMIDSTNGGLEVFKDNLDVISMRDEFVIDKSNEIFDNIQKYKGVYFCFKFSLFYLAGIKKIRLSNPVEDKVVWIW